MPSMEDRRTQQKLLDGYIGTVLSRDFSDINEHGKGVVRNYIRGTLIEDLELDPVPPCQLCERSSSDLVTDGGVFMCKRCLGNVNSVIKSAVNVVDRWDQ